MDLITLTALVLIVMALIVAAYALLPLERIADWLDDNDQALSHAAGMALWVLAVLLIGSVAVKAI